MFIGFLKEKQWPRKNIILRIQVQDVEADTFLHTPTANLARPTELLLISKTAVTKEGKSF